MGLGSPPYVSAVQAPIAGIADPRADKDKGQPFCPCRFASRAPRLGAGLRRRHVLSFWEATASYLPTRPAQLYDLLEELRKASRA
jgi:hypothetical protein